MRKEENTVHIDSQGRRYIVVPRQNGRRPTQAEIDTAIEKDWKARQRQAAVERGVTGMGDIKAAERKTARPQSSPPLFQKPETRLHPRPRPRTSSEEFRRIAKSFMNPEQRREYDADNDTFWDFNRTQWLREAFGPVSQRQDSDAGFIRERKREMNRQRERDHAMAEAWTDFVFQNVLGLAFAAPLGLMGKGLGAVATRAVAARGAGPLAQRAAGLAGTVVPPYAAQKVGQKTADAINRSLMGKDEWEASQQRIAQGRTAIQQRNPGLEPFMEVLTGLPTGTPVNPFAPGQFLSRTGDMLVEGGVGGAMSLIDQAVEGQPLDLRQARQSFITNMLGAGDTKVIRNSRIGLGPTRESGGLLPTTLEPPPSGGVPRPVAPITLFTERPVQGTSSPPVSPSSATVVSSSRSPAQHDKVTANGSATQPTMSVHYSASSAPPPAVLRSSPQGGIIPERRSWTAATYMPVHTESPLISELPDAPFPLFRERRAPTLLLQSAQPEPGDMSSIVLPGTAETGVRPVRGMDRPPTPIQSDALRMTSGPQQEPVVSPDITSPETVDYGTVPRRLDLSPPTDPMLSTDSAVGMGEVQGEATASPSHYKGVPISHPDIRSQGDLARAFQTPTAQGGFGYNASDARYTASRYDRIAREWAKRTGRQVTDWYTGHIAGIMNGGERLAQILADPQDTTLPHAAVEFLQDGRALVMALSNPKASSAIHELGHITRRVLANEDSEGYVALSTWAGAKRDKRTGQWIWDVRAEEQLAKAIETLEMARRESDAKYSALVTWMPPSIGRFLDLFRGLYIGFRSGVDRYTAERNGTLPEGINGEALATLDRWFGTDSERAAQAVGRAVGTARGILTSRGQAGRGQVSQTAQGTMSPTTQTDIARALAGLPLFQGSESGSVDPDLMARIVNAEQEATDRNDYIRRLTALLGGTSEVELAAAVMYEKREQRRANFGEHFSPPPGEPQSPLSRPLHVTLGNLMDKTQRPVGTGAPKNSRVVLEKDGVKFVAGRITREDWLERVRTLTPEEFKEARHWYENLRTRFVDIFGEANADRYMMAWLLSQQNVSPSLGMMHVLRVEDMEANRGVYKYDKKTGAVLKDADGNPISLQAGLAEDAIRSALRNLIPEKGQAAKLLDFVDSALQKTVRTWMGNDPRGGSPAVIDVWAGRDVGFLDATTKAWLTKKFGADAVKALEVDSEGAYTGEQYEHAAEFYNDLAKWLNERGEDGGDWKAHQVQAVGWIAIQKMMSGATEYPSDIINKNTRPVFIELEFGVGSPLRKQFGSLSTLPDSVAENITRDVLGKMAAEAARITGARVLGTAYGPGGYKGEVAPSGHFSVFGSPETIADFADVMGYLAQQTEIWTARPLKSGGSTAIDIYADVSDTSGTIVLTDPGKMKAFANDLQRSISGFEGFQPVMVNGQPGIRIINHTGKWGVKRLRALQAEIADIAAKHGIKHVHNSNINIDLIKQSHDWEVDTNGENYLRRTSERGRPALQGASRDLVPQVEEWIRDAFERYAGGDAAGNNAPPANGGGSGTTGSGAQRRRTGSSIPPERGTNRGEGRGEIESGGPPDDIAPGPPTGSIESNLFFQRGEGTRGQATQPALFAESGARAAPLFREPSGRRVAGRGQASRTQRLHGSMPLFRERGAGPQLFRPGPLDRAGTYHA